MIDPDHLASLLAAGPPLPLRAHGLHEYDDGDPPGIDGIEDARGEPVVVADLGVYPPSKPVADLLVAAVNALPDLLAVYRAALAWRAADCSHHPNCRDDFHGDDCPVVAAEQILAAAIDATRSRP